jgi:hypothetical protein
LVFPSPKRGDFRFKNAGLRSKNSTRQGQGKPIPKSGMVFGKPTERARRRTGYGRDLGKANKRILERLDLLFIFGPSEYFDGHNPTGDGFFFLKDSSNSFLYFLRSSWPKILSPYRTIDEKHLFSSADTFYRCQIIFDQFVYDSASEQRLL